MNRRLAGAICAALFLSASAAVADGDACEAFQGSTVEGLCADLVSSQSATGPLQDDAIADTRYKWKTPDEELPPPPAALCASGRGDFVSGADLSALLEALVATPAVEKLSLSGFKILGWLDAPESVPYSLEISKSVFCGPIDLSSSKFNGHLHLKENLVLAGPDDPREGVIFADGISVSDSFELQFSRFGALIVRRATIGQTLGITEATFGHLSLARTQVNLLALARSKQSESIAGRAKAWFEEQAGEGRYYNGYPTAFFASNAEMWDVVVADELYGDKFIAEGAVSAHRLKAGTVRFHFANLRAADFRELNSNKVEFKGTILGQTSHRDNCDINVARRYHTDFVSFSSASVATDFEFVSRKNDDDVTVRTSVTGPLCLRNMLVNGALDLSGLTASKLDLTETVVGRSIILSHPAHGRTKFTGKDAEASLSRLQTESIIFDTQNRLPPTLQMPYATIEKTPFLRNSGRSVSLADGVSGLLSGVEDKTSKIVALDVFINTLSANGQGGDSGALEFQKLQTQTDLLPFGAARITGEIAEVLGGYGLRPARTIFFALLLAICGAATVFQSVEGRWFLFRQVLANPRFRSRKNRANQMGPLRFWLWVDALVLSFDRLIPLVTIADAHKKLRFAQQPWVRAYFSLHALLGLLLAATVITVIGQTIGLRAL